MHIAHETAPSSVGRFIEFGPMHPALPYTGQQDCPCAAICFLECPRLLSSCIEVIGCDIDLNHWTFTEGFQVHWNPLTVVTLCTARRRRNERINEPFTFTLACKIPLLPLIKWELPRAGFYEKQSRKLL